MAWESRRGSGRYYTRSRRDSGRVVREYCGSGRLGELAAEMDQLECTRREIGRLKWKAEQEEIEQADGQMEKLEEMVKELMSLELNVAGYHQHHRGEWRKRRE